MLMLLIKVGNRSGSFINIIDNSTHAQDDILIKNTSGTGDDAGTTSVGGFAFTAKTSPLT